MQIDLSGRVALITGGSQGLGLAVARRMAASGADVGILARRPAQLADAKALIEESAKGRVEAFSCDVSRAEEIEAAHARMLERFGRVDILVNNAGSACRAPFTEITDAVWQADLDLKLFAAIRLTRLAWPGMAERRWGRVINVLNINAKAPAAGGAPTAVSRAAGMALTKVLSLEGAPYNILVNGLMVGSIVTEQVRRRFEANGEGQTFEQYLEPLHQRMPIGRLGTPEEFAQVACFFASDEASFLTGTALNVDGGLSPVT